MNRAYSLLTVKAVDEDHRIITGIATTPEVDRQGDIVEPEGAEFKLPLPFLWQHDSTQPIGHVIAAKVTKTGIEIKAQIAKMDEPGTLKDRLDEAWQSLKTGLVSGLSIGFKEVEYARIENSYGLRFLKWLWLELSAVTIPANASGAITTVKSLSHEQLAATGRDVASETNRPGDTGKKPHKPVNLKPKEGKTVNIKEQTAALEKKRDEHKARRLEIQEGVSKEGRTKNESEQEEFKTLGTELASVEMELKDLAELEASNIKTAKPAVGGNEDEAARARVPAFGSIPVKRNVPKGAIFTRLVATKWLARESGYSPLEIAKARFGDTPEVEQILKTAVAAGNTTDSVWAGPLVQLQNATNEFLDLLSPATIIGRIPGLMRVPFNVRVPRMTTDPTAYWVGEGKIKPVSSAAFDSVTLAFAKVAGIVPITEELARFSTPSAETLLQNALIRAVTYLTDRTFVDPSAAATDISPASITNGVSAIAPTGTTADAFRDDLASVLAAYAAANMPISGVVLIMTSQQAVRLSMMRNTLGVREFPDVGQAGGTVEGFTVITSENIPAAGGSPVDGYPIIAVHAASVMLADDGGVAIDMSREASLLMDTSPDSPETSSSVPINMWQHNMVAIKAERFITWKAGRTGAVQYIQGANYR